MPTERRWAGVSFATPVAAAVLACSFLLLAALSQPATATSQAAVRSEYARALALAEQAGSAGEAAVRSAALVEDKAAAVLGGDTGRRIASNRELTIRFMSLEEGRASKAEIQATLQRVRAIEAELRSAVGHSGSHAPPGRTYTRLPRLDAEPRVVEQELAPLSERVLSGLEKDTRLLEEAQTSHAAALESLSSIERIARPFAPSHHSLPEAIAEISDERTRELARAEAEAYDDETGRLADEREALGRERAQQELELERQREAERERITKKRAEEERARARLVATASSHDVVSRFKPFLSKGLFVEPGRFSEKPRPASAAALKRARVVSDIGVFRRWVQCTGAFKENDRPPWPRFVGSTRIWYGEVFKEFRTYLPIWEELGLVDP